MSKSLTPFLLSLAPLTLAACSGASAQLVDTAPSDGGSATSSGGGPTGSSAGSTNSGNGNGNGNGSANNGNDEDAGENGNGFDPGAAPAQCPAGGVAQVPSGGDSQSDATPFDTVACGSLEAGRSYWWTFTLPAATSKFALSFTGGLQIALTLDGTTVDVAPDATLPFRTKDPYYVQITPQGNDTTSYVLVVEEK
jgi:hypothetical protein